MSRHLSREGLRALLGGESDARTEAAFLAHLHSEPDCAECEALFGGLDDDEERALLALLAGAEQARDPGDAWQARTLAGGAAVGSVSWRRVAVGLGLSLVLLLSVGLWLFRPGPEAGTEGSQRIKGADTTRASLLNLRVGRIADGVHVVDPDRPLPAEGRLVFFVQVQSTCRLWLARLGPRDAEGLAGYANTPFVQLEGGESLLRVGDKALGLDLAGLRGEQIFMAGCLDLGAPAPAIEDLRKSPPTEALSLRLRLEAP